MTPYAASDLAQDWEFKILRSATGAFRNQEQLRRYLEDEARAGWILVEKFDNNRLRLKRPAKARELDGKLGIDPYRTYVGMSPSAVAWCVIGVTISMMVGFLLFIAAVAH